MELVKEMQRLRDIQIRIEQYLMFNHNEALMKQLNEDKTLCFVIAIQCSQIMADQDAINELDADRDKSKPLTVELIERLHPGLYESFMRHRAYIHKMNEFLV